MPYNEIRIETDLPSAVFVEELRWAVSKYNSEKSNNATDVKLDDFEVSEAHGVSGAEIAIFFATAIAGGVTYDVCKYVLIDLLIPRINRKYGDKSASKKQ